MTLTAIFGFFACAVVGTSLICMVGLRRGELGGQRGLDLRREGETSLICKVGLRRRLGCEGDDEAADDGETSLICTVGLRRLVLNPEEVVVDDSWNFPDLYGGIATSSCDRERSGRPPPPWDFPDLHGGIATAT